MRRYWSGQMMWEFYRELHGANGPVYLKVNHLAPETVILHTTERPSRGRFHAGRSVSYGEDLLEMSISEIGLCSGHSASGVWVNERGETTVPGLYAAGDMASVPHGYMLGAFTYGKICGRNAVEYIGSLSLNTSCAGTDVSRRSLRLICRVPGRRRRLYPRNS